MTERPDLFQEHRPDLTQDEVGDATKQDRIVLSFNALPVTHEGVVMAVAVKFRLGSGAEETVVIDRYPASILRGMFEELDAKGWQMATVGRPEGKPH